MGQPRRFHWHVRLQNKTRCLRDTAQKDNAGLYSSSLYAIWLIHTPGHLQHNTDRLGPKVCKIEVSDASELNYVSSNADDDERLCVHYPPLQELEKPARVGLVARSELEEIQRLVPNVDLVSYDADASLHDEGKRETRDVIFKYYFHTEDLHQRWDELNIWMRLPPHPNIVPFDRLVVEEMHDRQVVVGFTSLYIRGGTLHNTRGKPYRRTFRLKWLLQLTNLVNDLNLRFGIEHQDIAPRNLVVDEATDNIMLFDFNCSARIGGPLRNGESVYDFEKNDVKGVIFTVYEILTQDYDLRFTSCEDRRFPKLLDFKEWKKHPDVQLDHPLKDYRAALNAWLKARKGLDPVIVYTDAPEYLDWPPMQEPSCSTHEHPTHPILGEHSKSQSHRGGDADVVVQVPTSGVLPRWAFSRRDERKSNRQVIEWERPATTKMTKMEEGIRLFADGKTEVASLQRSRWTPGKS